MKTFVISNKEIFIHYDVSIDGIVRKKDTGNIISYQVTTKGYRTVLIRVDNRQRQMRLHRLVALRYIPNPDNYTDINHKDGDKKNNNVNNLEWCTPQYNQNHVYISGFAKYGEKNKNTQMKNNDVIIIRNRMSYGDSYLKIFKDYSDKISWWSFREICRGKSWKHLL